MNRHPVLQDFWDLQLSRHKLAAEARKASPSDFDVRISAVLRAAHRELAERLAPLGFRLNRRREWLSRRREHLIHRIAFTTSSSNIPDTFIALYPNFWVISTPFATWRKQTGGVKSDDLAIRHLGGFESDSASIEHDIGPPSTRTSELDHLEGEIRAKALPFFESFADPDAALASAATWPSLGFANYEIECAVEYALFRNRRDIAQTLVNRFFTLHPALLPDYHAFAAGERLYPSNDGPDVFAYDLAAVVCRHGLASPVAG